MSAYRYQIRDTQTGETVIGTQPTKGGSTCDFMWTSEIGE